MRVLSAVVSFLAFNALGVLLMQSEPGHEPALLSAILGSWMDLAQVVKTYGYQPVGLSFMALGLYIALVCLVLSQPRGRWWPERLRDVSSRRAVPPDPLGGTRG
ncbi:hypothetical protein ACRDNQ_12610 [Palleronia sp. KMU-117]|uniref:hypothetical protein n=1 Tax=Palleronia sp. KMU-117 TaxID=3434108 RepID=UPI003D716167